MPDSLQPGLDWNFLSEVRGLPQISIGDQIFYGKPAKGNSDNGPSDKVLFELVYDVNGRVVDQNGRYKLFKDKPAASQYSNLLGN